MKKSYAAAAAAVLAVFSVLTACTAESPSGIPELTTAEVTAAAGTQPGGEKDTGYTRGGIAFTAGEGIKTADTGMAGTRGQDNTLLCEDTGSRSYTMTARVTVSGATAGYIAFKYLSDGNYYSLSFDYAKNEMILSLIRGGETFSVSRRAVTSPLSDGIDIRIECENTFFTLYYGDEGAETFGFDGVLQFPRAQGFFVDLGTGASIAVNDFQYSIRESVKVNTDKMYINPVVTGADPYVYYEGGVYYLYSTNAPNAGYKVSTSDDLVHWTDMGYCLKNADVYGEPTSSKGFWAPEVYKYGDRYYLLYTVNEHLGMATADSPLGPFTNNSGTYINNNKNEIDGHLFFDDNGDVYIFFVRTGKSAVTGKWGNEIWGGRFNMETMKYSDERLLLYPAAGTWEFVDGYVAEGPAVIKHNGTYYLTYSANGYTSKDYAIGYAVSSSPLGQYQKYENNPILSKAVNSGVYGTGHHSFVTTPAGNLVMVYHRHMSENEVSPRQVCIDVCSFVPSADGKADILAVNGPSSVYREIPQ